MLLSGFTVLTNYKQCSNHISNEVLWTPQSFVYYQFRYLDKPIETFETIRTEVFFLAIATIPL